MGKKSREKRQRQADTKRTDRILYQDESRIVMTDMTDEELEETKEMRDEIWSRQV